MDAKRNRECVLIIEDDAALAEAWRTKLDAAGYDVVICLQIDSGYEACEARWPDLIVLDGFFLDGKGIPKGEGAVLFCSKIVRYAADHNEPLPPIIGVTGVRPSEEYGEDVFSPISLEVMPTRMRKPFAPEALVYEVERAFAQLTSDN